MAGDALPERVNILVLTPITEQRIAQLRAIAPERLRVIAAHDELHEAIRADSPPALLGSAPPREVKRTMTDATRDEILASAHAILMPFPFPKGLLAGARSAKFLHWPFAGVSNLRGSAYWDAAVPQTSSRGATNALPIAELTMAAAVMFAKGLHVAVRNTDAGNFRRDAFPLMRTVTGKTMGIVGLGGIGAHVARLARGAGMRVVATRRSAERRAADTDGVDVLYPAAELHQMLAECDFVAVCAMLTPETEGLLNDAAFDAMKPGAVLLNVARGEIVDEDALVRALRSGKLAGAYIDVYRDDFVSPPSPRLATAPNIVITPHVSGRSDVNHAYAFDIFRDNVRRMLNGEPLVNLIDWSRGY